MNHETIGQLRKNLRVLARAHLDFTGWGSGVVADKMTAAAIKFQLATGNYEQAALPDLIEAYRLIQQKTGRAFDPVQAARAELAWWVARRTPGQNSPEQVGQKIAQLYAILHGQDHPAFHEAGLLRARAAHLRDQGGAQAPWDKIEALLLQSYQKLGDGMQ